MNYKAIDVLKAAKRTYENYGDADYAKGKANNFIRRCGAKLEDGTEQMISADRVKQVVYAALDADSEQEFWANLSAIRC